MSITPFKKKDDIDFSKVVDYIPHTNDLLCKTLYDIGISCFNDDRHDVPKFRYKRRYYIDKRGRLVLNTHPSRFHHWWAPGGIFILAAEMLGTASKIMQMLADFENQDNEFNMNDISMEIEGLIDQSVDNIMNDGRPRLHEKRILFQRPRMTEIIKPKPKPFIDKSKIIEVQSEPVNMKQTKTIIIPTIPDSVKRIMQNAGKM